MSPKHKHKNEATSRVNAMWKAVIIYNICNVSKGGKMYESEDLQVCVAYVIADNCMFTQLSICMPAIFKGILFSYMDISTVNECSLLSATKLYKVSLLPSSYETGKDMYMEVLLVCLLKLQKYIQK